MTRAPAQPGAPALRRLLCSIGLMLATAAALAQAPRPASPGVAADAVLLGQSAKMSGSAGTMAGRPYRDGLLLAFAAANLAGGVHGRRIELLTLDDQNDGAKALANTRTLIEDKRVFALAGYTFTGSVQAALPLLRTHGVPLVGAYTGTPELYDDSQPTVFSLRASFADELAAIVRHIETIGYTRVALVHYTTRLGTELRDDVAQRLQRAGRDLDRAAFVKALEGVYLEGPDHFRIQFGSGRRAGSRYTNIVMVADKDRITD